MPARKVNSRRASKTPSLTATGAQKNAPIHKYLASGLIAFWIVGSVVIRLPKKAGIKEAALATAAAVYIGGATEMANKKRSVSDHVRD